MGFNSALKELKRSWVSLLSLVNAKPSGAPVSSGSHVLCVRECHWCPSQDMSIFVTGLPANSNTY